MPFSYKAFSEYLAPHNQDSFFVATGVKDKIIEIISNSKPKKYRLGRWTNNPGALVSKRGDSKVD